MVGLVLVGVDAVAQLIVPALIRTGIDRGVTADSQATLLLVSCIALTVVGAGGMINGSASALPAGPVAAAHHAGGRAPAHDRVSS